MYSIIILHALQFSVHSEQWVGHVYVTNIIFILSKFVNHVTVFYLDRFYYSVMYTVFGLTF